MRIAILYIISSVLLFTAHTLYGQQQTTEIKRFNDLPKIDSEIIYELGYGGVLSSDGRNNQNGIFNIGWNRRTTSTAWHGIYAHAFLNERSLAGFLYRYTNETNHGAQWYLGGGPVMRITDNPSIGAALRTGFPANRYVGLQAGGHWYVEDGSSVFQVYGGLQLNHEAAGVGTGVLVVLGAILYSIIRNSQ